MTSDTTHAPARPRIILGAKDREREAIFRLLSFYAKDCDIIAPEDETRKVIGGFSRLAPPREGDVWVECHCGPLPVQEGKVTFRTWAARDMAERSITYTVIDHHGMDDPEGPWMLGVSSLGQILAWLAETGRLTGRPGLDTGLLYRGDGRGWYMDPHIQSGSHGLVYVDQSGHGWGGWLQCWSEDGGSPLDLICIGESDHNRAAFLSPGAWEPRGGRPQRRGLATSQARAVEWAATTLAEEMGAEPEAVQRLLLETEALIGGAPFLPGTAVSDLRDISSLTPPAPGVSGPAGEGGTHWRYVPDAACIGGFMYVGWGTQGYDPKTGLRHLGFGGAGEGSPNGPVDFHPILRALGAQRTYPARISRGVGGGYAPWVPVE